MTRWGRVARGTVAAVVSLFIAAFSHSLAGGSLPGVVGISLCVTFSVIACTALVGRRMPLTRLAASIAVSQAMYHWLFGALGSTAVATAEPLGHIHHAPIDFSLLTMSAHTHGDMLLAHIAAAVATFAVLAFGERNITAAVRAARSFVLSLIPSFTDAPVACVPARLSASGVRVSVLQFSRVDHSGLRHRGPPLACIV